MEKGADLETLVTNLKEEIETVKDPLLRDVLAIQLDAVVQAYQIELGKNPITKVKGQVAFENDYGTRDNPKQDRKADNTEAYKFFVIGDIDNFGQFNKQYGQEIGDLVLKAVANVIETSLHRKGDSYHLHGEEFLQTYEGITNYKDAINLAQRVQEKVKDTKLILHKDGSSEIIYPQQEYIPLEGDQELHTSITFGLSRHEKGEKNIYATVNKADEYMQMGKKEVKGQTYCFDLAYFQEQQLKNKSN